MTGAPLSEGAQSFSLWCDAEPGATTLQSNHGSRELGGARRVGPLSSPGAMRRGQRPDLEDIRKRLSRWDRWTKEDIRQFVEHDLPDLLAYAERLERVVQDLNRGEIPEE